MCARRSPATNGSIGRRDYPDKVIYQWSHWQRRGMDLGFGPGPQQRTVARGRPGLASRGENHAFAPRQTVRAAFVC